MTKEELKQEVKEYLRGYTRLNGGGIFHCDVLDLILGFAEPREQRIEELEECIEDLQKDCENKTNVIADYTNKLAFCNTKIAELEAQIEKMKCCGNCANLCECGIRGFEECKNKNKWELREIKEK